MSTLICGITLADCFGNKRRLKVRMGADGSLAYHLKVCVGATSLSISNLSLKRPLPEMRSGTLEGTLESILSVLRESCTEVVGYDQYAAVAATTEPQCPHCGGVL